MDIYIMPQKKYILSEKRLVLLKDIADVYSADFNVEEIKKTIEKHSEKNQEYIKGGVRIDIWTHLMRGCIIDYVH